MNTNAWKKKLDELESIDENENVESLDVLVESIWNASICVDVFMTTIINIVTSKKLSDSLILINDKDSNIENRLFVMKNKLEENVDWFSIETSKKTYVRTRIDEDAMKHLTSRFKKNSIKSFLIAEEIFDDLNRVFDDFNKRINVLKIYKRLKQIKANKNFILSLRNFNVWRAIQRFMTKKFFWKISKIKCFEICRKY